MSRLKIGTYLFWGIIAIHFAVAVLTIHIVSNLTVASIIIWFVVLTELSIPAVLINKKVEYFYGFSFFIFQLIC